LGGGPVMLGQGDCNFDCFFEALAPLNYRGPLIMQAWRDDQGVDVFRKQLDFIRPYLQSHLNGRTP
ncbi:MAG: sugar phosphate isomerase/epimerase, partial [Acidobacteriota bacterium]|nr:sugar phosphate isomerase/epimerase [Acidobacteriota bacterium]